MKDGFCYLLGSNKGTGRTAFVFISFYRILHKLTTHSTNVNAGVQVKTASIPEPTQGSTTCSTGINCPNTDQCLYPANGKNFYARCNYDYYGGDINVGSTESLTECVDNCSTFAGCVAVTWVEGTCYLKNNNTKIVYNSWVDSKSSALLSLTLAELTRYQVPTSVLEAPAPPLYRPVRLVNLALSRPTHAI
jgi:hypothetical protein